MSFVGHSVVSHVLGVTHGVVSHILGLTHGVVTTQLFHVQDIESIGFHQCYIAPENAKDARNFSKHYKDATLREEA